MHNLYLMYGAETNRLHRIPLSSLWMIYTIEQFRILMMMKMTMIKKCHKKIPKILNHNHKSQRKIKYSFQLQKVMMIMINKYQIIDQISQMMSLITGRVIIHQIIIIIIHQIIIIISLIIKQFIDHI